jgi:hypothetical protein
MQLVNLPSFSAGVHMHDVTPSDSISFFGGRTNWIVVAK